MSKPQAVPTTMTDIQTWLESQGLAKYAAEFLAQDVSVDLLPDLSDADLRELGVASLGDRKRLLKAAVVPLAAAAVLVAPSPLATNQAAATRLPAPNEEGERRHATVMFSDLTGYTALNEAFDPEEVEEIMSRIKREAIAVIERHGGRVNQFVGDEVMAMFGIPVARRDDARRAIRAALELHHIVDGIAAGVSERLGRVLSMHTGLHTGLVIARRSDSRSGDYTLTGDTVNTAARLRGLAQPGEVVVSPQTWQQVAEHFEGEAGHPIEVKGKERPLVPYRIWGERAVPKGGVRPLVGRAQEMQQFESLVHGCLSRQHGRIVFVRGDPGLGKSRLVAEFLDVARERGLVCHATTILDFGARTGHDAMRTLVQSLLGLAPDADEPTRREALERTGLQAADGADLTPYLFELLDVVPSSAARALLAALGDETRRGLTIDALGQLVRQQVLQAPTLLLVEDLHWADAWTLRQLGAWLPFTATMPLLVMFTTRFASDPSVGEWRSTLHSLPVSSMDLGPLPVDEAMRLAAGAASISDTLMRSCVERAEGNPLFLEQLLLNAGDEGADTLPGSIQALIQARMDRLPASDKSALQAAAVLGQYAPLAAIQYLVGDPAYEPRLLTEQFLLRAEEDNLVFCHALIRDGAYASLLHTRRRQLHQAAGSWISAHDAALAAEHFERAEDPRAAAAYLLASEAQANSYRFVEALELVERALKLPDLAGQMFALELARARLLLAVGHPASAIAASTLAINAADSDAERAVGMIAMASGMRLVDRTREGLDVLARAQPLAEQAGLTLDLSHLHELRGNLLFVLGQAHACQLAHETALALARAAGSAEAECAALGGLGDACFAQSQIVSGAHRIRECLAMAREQGFLKIEMAYLPMLGWAEYYMMRLPKAVGLSEQALAMAARLRNPRAEMMAMSQLVMLDGCVRGNHRDAFPLIDRALEMARALGSRRMEALGWFFRTLLLLRSGDSAGARTELAHAFELLGSDSGTLAFVGPQLFGVQALLSTDAPTRRKALTSGHELLITHALSFNHFVLLDFAIQSSVDGADWDEAWRYCDALEAHSAAETFPWADFIVARGRALIRQGKGEGGAELVQQLRLLRKQAADSEMNFYLIGIDAALASQDHASA